MLSFEIEIETEMETEIETETRTEWKSTTREASASTARDGSTTRKACKKRMEAINKKMGEVLEEDVQNLRSFTFENAKRGRKRVARIR